jgi:serine/threonine protein kinase
VLKVMDFGIARSLSLGGERITEKGQVIGTPTYMAPELMIGGQATARTDLYAVGVVLYECLTGDVPFKAEQPQELIAEIYRSAEIPLELTSPDIPTALAKLIHQQLSFDAARRASSARELAQRLSEVELSDR